MSEWEDSNDPAPARSNLVLTGTAGFVVSIHAPAVRGADGHHSTHHDA